MADWVLSSGDYMRPHISRIAGDLDSGQESTAQSFLVGALLEYDSAVSTSNFRLKQAVRSASTVTSTALIGVAADPASSVTDRVITYWPISPLIEFKARTRGSTIASTNVGQAYGLFFDSTKNVFGVDLANTASTSLRVVVTGLIDAIGDSGGYVRFKFGTPVGTASTNTFGGGASPLRY